MAQETVAEEELQMSRDPTPKSDALRAMREAEFTSSRPAPRKPVQDLRKDVAAIPAKKQRSPKAKKRISRRKA
jgi:hypothetical protein